MPEKAESQDQQTRDRPEENEQEQAPLQEAEQGGQAPEEPAGDEAAPDEASEVESLQARLEEALAKADENWQLALRTKAELENLEKRAQRDIENAHKFGLEKLATELLGVRDSMELGLNAAQESDNVESLREGVELTLKMLVQTMEKFGIEEINPEHERFNPELHQAMSTQESSKLEPNTVVSVMQKGYTLNGRLLRPALVTVAKTPEQ